jgi:hypothetical protein
VSGLALRNESIAARFMAWAVGKEIHWPTGGEGRVREGVVTWRWVSECSGRLWALIGQKGGGVGWDIGIPTLATLVGTP